MINTKRILIHWVLICTTFKNLICLLEFTRSLKKFVKTCWRNSWNVRSSTNVIQFIVQQIKYAHSWQGFSKNGPRRNIAQLWKLFSYLTIMILKISFRNCVSSLLSPHYKTFLFTGPFDLNKAQSLYNNPAQKLIGTNSNTTHFYIDYTELFTNRLQIHNS